MRKHLKLVLEQNPGDRTVAQIDPRHNDPEGRISGVISHIAHHLGVDGTLGLLEMGGGEELEQDGTQTPVPGAVLESSILNNSSFGNYPMSSSLFSRVVGQGRMAPALEQELHFLNEQFDSALSVYRRISAGQFSPALVLEADRLVPGLGAAQRVGLAGVRNQSLALEGVLESIWEFIKNIAHKIGEIIQRFIDWVKSKFTKKAEDTTKKAEEVAKQAEVIKTVEADFLKFAQEWLAGEGKDSGLATKLKNAPGLVQLVIEEKGWFPMGAQLLKARGDAGKFLTDELGKDLKEFSAFVTALHRNEDIQIPECVKRMAEYDLQVAVGSGHKGVKEAVEESQKLRKEGEAAAAAPVQLADLFKFVSGFHGKYAEHLKIIQNVDVAFQMDDVQKQIDHIRRLLDGGAKPTGDGATPEMLDLVRKGLVNAFEHFGSFVALFEESMHWVQWITPAFLIFEQLEDFVSPLKKKVDEEKLGPDTKEGKVIAAFMKAFPDAAGE